MHACLPVSVLCLGALCWSASTSGVGALLPTPILQADDMPCLLLLTLGEGKAWLLPPSSCVMFHWHRLSSSPCLPAM